jgi:hypothetical protein
MNRMTVPHFLHPQFFGLELPIMVKRASERGIVKHADEVRAHAYHRLRPKPRLRWSNEVS